VLAGGRNSRLYRRLVYDLQIADGVSAYQASSRLGSDFHLSATARAGHTLAELEAVILEELERIRQEAPESRELQRFINQRETRFYEALEQTGSKADRLNAYYFHTGRADYFNQDLARYRALTPEALTAAAGHLDPERRVVLSIVPQQRTDLAAGDSRLLPPLDYARSPAGRVTP
jgi:zinc protease